MKKIVRSSIFLFSFIIILSGCRTQEKQPVQQSVHEHLEHLFDNGGEKTKEVLDASEIKGYDSNNKMKEMVSDVLSQKGEYEQKYKEMCEEIECEMEEAEMEGDYYISDIPILWWDAIENRIDEHYAKLAIFSEKHEILGALDLNDDLDGELLFSFMAGGDTFFKEMEEAPKDKYLFILNQSQMSMLDENNKILTPNANPEVMIQGDYYHALPYQTLAISYSDLVDEKHLMKQKRN